MLWGVAVGAIAASAMFVLLATDPIMIMNDATGFGSYSIQSDIRYDQVSGLELDVYRPAGSAQSLPVVIFLHGESGSSGGKKDYRFVGAALARRGIVAVIPDYRLYPQSLFPVFLQDSALAVRWTNSNIAPFGGDPHRVILMGHSAGAYTAAMLIFDRRWLQTAGLFADRDLIAWVGLAGPYDLASVDPKSLGKAFSSVQDKASIQPIDFANGKGPPAFLAAGLADKTVSPSSTLGLGSRIRQAGGTAKIMIYPDLGHLMLIGTFSPIFGYLGSVPADVTGFVLDRTDSRVGD